MVSRLENANAIDADKEWRILQERALALARRVEASAVDDDFLTVVSFVIGDENYALETRYVREIAKMVEIVPLPETPNFVVGAAKFRGEICVIFDLRALLCASQVALSPTSQVIVFGVERVEFGIVANNVNGISNVPRNAIRLSAKHRSDDGENLLAGMMEDATLIVDGEVLLVDPRLFLGRQIQKYSEVRHGD